MASTREGIMHIIRPQSSFPDSTGKKLYFRTLVTLVGQAVHETNKQQHAPLSHVCHLLNIDPTRKVEIYGRLHYIQFKKGESIYKVGDPFLGVYIVAAGSVKGTLTQDGRETITGLFLPGEIIGFGGFDGLIHTSAAIAMSDLLVVWLPYKALSGYSKIYGDFEEVILRTFARQVFDASVLLDVITSTNALVATAFFLVSLAARMGTYDDPMTELHLNLTKRDFAIYIGMSQELLGHVLDGLVEKNLIRSEGNTIYLDDIVKLREISSPYSAHLASR